MKDCPRILLVDDEFVFSELTREYLDAKSCKTVLKHNAEAGLKAFKSERFDLCILDVKMPVKDGFELAEEIREFDEYVPIIFLTGQTQKKDRIKGLSLGADDYITKPFSMEELFLRITNILKRTQFQTRKQEEVTQYQVGGFDFDSTARVLVLAEKSSKLTAIESRLLKMFCDNDDGMIEREDALKKIWNDEHALHGRSLNVYVSKLRSHLKEDSNIEILNVHGVGYKMVFK